MVGRTDVVGLPVDRLRRILAPFDGIAPDGLTVGLEGVDGTLLLGEAPRVGSASRWTRELRANGALVGRLVACSPSTGSATADAAIEAMATALEEVIELDRVLRISGGAQEVGTDPATLASELAMSRVQQRTIVSLVAPDVAGYDLASHYEPAREIGGDFFELFRIRRRGHPLGIVIADVAGKGIAAAMLMAFARPVIHTALTAASGPSDALERTNRILVTELHTTLFITALAARLDVKSGILRIANAGHELPYLVPGDGSPITPVDGGGPLMGAFSRLALTETELELQPGDQLVLYTDGVTDTRATSGERFGRERMLAAIERSRGGTALDLVSAIRDDLGSFCVAARPADDVTIVVVGRNRAS
jgi:serine phosphatase RsbU (regulator of sigma subunit)